MRLEGISDDVGRALAMNRRPAFDLDFARETYSDFAVSLNGKSRG